jgi:hypothetical protein
MPNAAISTIVTNLATVSYDTTARDNFEDGIINELARGANPGILAQVGTAFIAVTNATERYSLPVASGARTIITLHHDNVQLLQVRKDEAWHYDTSWRRTPARKTIGYVLDPEDRTSFSVIPPPIADGATIGGQTPTTITAWPTGNITVIYANADTAFAGTTYDDLKMPIALETLQREFARDSNHQDNAFAESCGLLASIFYGMFMPLGRPG